VSDVKSALSKTVNNATTELDDFKIIEGIGSKIETALKTAAIKTYPDLRASDSEVLKVILNTASPAFNMHDPETWPYQADLAYKNKLDKL
jgi:predicted flap endonuclease-1-like 5' DNA nuclease